MLHSQRSLTPGLNRWKTAGFCLKKSRLFSWQANAIDRWLRSTHLPSLACKISSICYYPRSMRPRSTPNTRPLRRLEVLEIPKISVLYTKWSSTGNSKARLDTKGKAYLTLDETFRGLPSLRKTILSNQFLQLVLTACLYLRKLCTTTQKIACTRANRIYSILVKVSVWPK